MPQRLVIGLILILAANAAFAQPPALQVVVLEGEDAVNIIQQKTAVRPLVEVRDRNNLPVPGALVTFSIPGGASTFGGASTLTVATNAAGQAAVTGLTPSAAGAFQIQVSAAFQGQVATATIAQTNVLTAAQAAAAGAATGGSSASSAGGGAGGAGGGAGGAGGAAGAGGLSTTTLVVAGAAVAGGAVAATQVAGKDEDEDGIRFEGPVSGTITSVITSRNFPSNTCTITRQIAATARLILETNTTTSVSGILDINGTDSVVVQSCPGANTGGNFGGAIPVSGTQASIRGSETRDDTRTQAGGETITSVRTFAFDGSLNGNTATGTIKHEGRSVSTGGGGGPVDESSSGSFAVTLTKS
jgi:hypothetical protein